MIEGRNQLQCGSQSRAGPVHGRWLHLLDQPIPPRLQIADGKQPHGFTREHSRQVVLHSGCATEMLSAALQVALIRGDRVGDGQGFVARRAGLATGQRLGDITRLVECEYVDAVRIFKIVSLGKTLGPVGTVTVSGLDHPPAIAFVSSEEEHDPTCE